jgi:ABC-2 type transport system permease protein
MNAYITMLKTQGMMVLQYRAQAYAGVFTQFAFGLMRVYMIVAFYQGVANPSDLPDFTLSQSVSYIWITQMLLTFIAWGPDPLVVSMIKEGTIAYEMVRPVRLSLAWWMRSLAFRGMMPLMRALPILLLSLIMPVPYRLYTIGFNWSIPVTLCLAWLLAGCLNNLFNILTLFLMSDDGLVRLIPIIMLFFGGLALPIPLFPQSFQFWLMRTPFVGLMDIPSRIITGHLVTNALYSGLFTQTLWILILVLVNDWLLEHRLKRAIIQGG